MTEKNCFRVFIRTDSQEFMDLISDYRLHGYITKSEMIVDLVLKNFGAGKEDRMKKQVEEYLEKHAREMVGEYFSSEQFKRWIEVLLEEYLITNQERPFR